MAFIDLFIKNDEVQNEQVVQHVNEPPVKKNVNIAVSETINTPSSEIQPSSSILTDDNIVNMIWDKIIGANRPGPDYLELKNNVEALEDLPISTNQKLISAFKVLKKGYPNFQKDDITKAIDFYINVVNDEKNAGLKQLEELKIKNIDGVETEIKMMQNKAEELKRQYDELQSNIGAKSIELTQARNDIELKYNTFIGSVDAVMNVLSSDKENIMAINF